MKKYLGQLLVVATMALQGIDVVLKDIDIITTPDDLVIFEKIFKNNIVKPICKKLPYKKAVLKSMN